MVLPGCVIVLVLACVESSEVCVGGPGIQWGEEVFIALLAVCWDASPATCGVEHLDDDIGGPSESSGAEQAQKGVELCARVVIRPPQQGALGSSCHLLLQRPNDARPSDVEVSSSGLCLQGVVKRVRCGGVVERPGNSGWRVEGEERANPGGRLGPPRPGAAIGAVGRCLGEHGVLGALGSICVCVWSRLCAEGRRFAGGAWGVARRGASGDAEPKQAEKRGMCPHGLAPKKSRCGGIVAHLPLVVPFVLWGVGRG